MWRKGWTRPNETEPVSLCNACGILFKRGWFCVHCEEVYRKLEGADDDAAGPAGPWIGCDFCERWSHVSCELAHAPDALASTFPAATSTADLSAAPAAAEQPPRQEDNAETVVEMKPPAPSIPDPRVSLFNADGAAMSSTPYRCPECRGKLDDAYVPPPRALASHASQTSLAAGAHVLDGRVVSLFLMLVWAIGMTSCFVYRFTTDRSCEPVINEPPAAAAAAAGRADEPRRPGPTRTARRPRVNVLAVGRVSRR